MYVYVAVAALALLLQIVVRNFQILLLFHFIMFDVWSLDFHPKYHALSCSQICKFDKPLQMQSVGYYVSDDSYLPNLFMCQLIMDTVRNGGLANLQIYAHNNARYLEWKSKDQTSNMMKWNLPFLYGFPGKQSIHLNKFGRLFSKNLFPISKVTRYKKSNNYIFLAIFGKNR